MQLIFLAIAALALAAPAPAFAAATKTPAKSTAAQAGPGPALLGSSKSWSAYAAGADKTLVCYLVGHPAKSVPPNAKRRPDAHVTHRPGENAVNVVNFDLGYAAKAGSDATLAIDGKTYSLFTNKDSAWNSDAAADKAVTLALAKGSEAVLTATPEKGKPTTDTYSLVGFGEALALIDKACKVKR